MHFHLKILDYLKKYKEERDNNFNFLVRQRASKNDKKYPGGKFAHGIVFQGTDEYCFVGLIDRNAGTNATRSVGFVISPVKEKKLRVTLDIVFPGETDEELLTFYKDLASKIDGINWDNKGTRGYLNLGEFPEDEPDKLYDWIDKYYPIIRKTALDSGIDNLLPSNEKFEKLQENLNIRLKEDKVSVNYWLFQGNPKIFDFESALAEGSLNDFTVTSHKDKIQVGDKVIIWLTGHKKGCYALSEVTSEPNTNSESADDQHWKTEQLTDLKAGIEITHNFYDDPVTWNEIKDKDEFKNFNAGNQGTNYRATKEEFESFLKIRERNTTFEYVKNDLSEAHFNNYMQFLRKIIAANNIKYDDKRTVFSIRKNRLNFTIGQRYCFNVFHNDKRGTYGVISSSKIKEGSGKYEGGNYQAYYTFFNDIKDIYDNWETVNRALENELNRTAKSSYLKHNDSDFESYVFDKVDIPLQDNDSMKSSLNKIIYGPPGTGKTYKLQAEYFKEFTQYKNTTSKEDYLIEKMEILSWWQVLYIALLDLGKTSVKEIVAHPTVHAKAKLSNINNLRASIWGALQRHTNDECKNVNVVSRAAIKPFWKTGDSQWQLSDENKGIELFPEAKEILDAYNNYEQKGGQEIKNYSFVTFHQSFTYEDFIEGIKPILEDENGDLRYEVSDGVFKKLAIKAENDPVNRYAIFIDEINRGNVASIFGELITLIEKDKRAGEENELSVILPYSKTKFTVPQNLSIIGTMNTADRSIEALDSALRRRFEFEEILPNYELIDGELDSQEFEGHKLSKILQTINDRITILINRDHQIGHSYFLKLKRSKDVEQDLKYVFTNEIIPLLQEYFFNDYTKIAMVIGEGFMDNDRYKNVTFAKNAGSYNSDYDDITTYEIKKDPDLKEAIKLLMGEQQDGETD